MHPEVQREYARFASLLPEEDCYRSATAIGIQEVLKAHFLIADHFIDEGRGLGGVGPRDLGLLHSALLRQHVGYGGIVKWSSKFDIMATLFYGLIKDHPFFDANKRTAFLCLLYHMQKFGLVPTVTQSELEDFTVIVAENGLGRFRRYQDLEEKSDDPEVDYISYYIKNNSRHIEKRGHTITYRQLKRILNRFGYDLCNPYHNYIDVVRIAERRRWVFGSKEKIGVKVAQIGFPGWTSQVGPGAVSSVRNKTGLIPKYGYDSKTFYGGEEPIDCLIAEYSEPLSRLASR